MYIRRKSYSVIIDKNGEEKLFSTTEIMSEESYLEKLYSENEPEQKEFGKFDLQVAKKIYPKYAEYVNNDPKYLKQYLREYRNSRVFGNISKAAGSNKIKKNLDIRLYENDIKNVSKKNKKISEGHRNKTGRTIMNI